MLYIETYIHMQMDILHLLTYVHTNMNIGDLQSREISKRCVKRNLWGSLVNSHTNYSSKTPAHPFWWWRMGTIWILNFQVVSSDILSADLIVFLFSHLLFSPTEMVRRWGIRWKQASILRENTPNAQLVNLFPSLYLTCSHNKAEKILGWQVSHSNNSDS